MRHKRYASVTPALRQELVTPSSHREAHHTPRSFQTLTKTGAFGDSFLECLDAWVIWGCLETRKTDSRCSESPVFADPGGRLKIATFCQFLGSPMVTWLTPWLSNVPQAPQGARAAPEVNKSEISVRPRRDPREHGVSTK